MTRFEAAGDRSVESLGARLKREREQRKITLDEISMSTKIGTRFLIAIEEEHFDQLPGGIFNKGFVKAYARSVGVNEAEAVAEYELVTAPSTPETQPDMTLAALAAPATTTPSGFPDEDPGDGGLSRIPWEWFAIALLVIAFGFAIWGFYSREIREVRTLSGDSLAAPQPSKTPIAQEAESPAVSATPVPEVPNATPQSPESKPLAGAMQGSAQATAPPDSAANPGAFLVQIKAREDSWIAISADGRQIMQDTLRASTEKSIGAHDQIVIKTGNAGALDISFNGKKLPAQGTHNEVKTLTFDPNGLKL
jgi:cytoskeleton protein RodZ